MLAGSGVRLLVQAMYFALLARALGANQYGAFVGVVALIAILSPFAPLGTGQLLVRNVSRDRGTFRSSWGNALWMTGVSGVILLGVVILSAKYVLTDKIPLMLVFLVGLSDLVFAGIVGVGSQAFQAIEELHQTAHVYVVLTSIRAFAALALYLTVHHPTALQWGLLYCLSSAIGAAYTFYFVCSKLGYPGLSLKRLRLDLLEGFYFSISLSSASIYNNIDKAMLVRLATFDAAGIYGAAYRLIDLSFQPVSALLASTFPMFFQHGTRGLLGTKRLLKRFLPYSFTYAILAVGLLALAAPLLPLVLGHDFMESVGALKWLSPILVFRSFHYFLADSLTGAGFQGLRSGIQVFVAAFNVLLNFWLIPAFSWHGAAWASLASDGALAVGMFVAVALLSRRKPIPEADYGIEPRTYL
jgi:O-antigen/teichoic acid export membrane protein